VAVPGLVVGLRGSLGAGKTAFVRAVADGLSVPNPNVVTSPTFILVQEYFGRIPLYHFDVYRLRSPDEFAELGVHEYFDGDGIVLVEWSDRVDGLMPAERFEVTFWVAGETARDILAECRGERFGAVFEDWLARIATATQATDRPIGYSSDSSSS
jgi:tRNA threonylcarbamoyladenosine biosynthesis protein TsaE